MAGERRISGISVPISANTSGFSKGLKTCAKDAEVFGSKTAHAWSAMGQGIGNSIDKIGAKLKTLGGTNLGMLTKGLAGLAAAAAASAAAIGTIGFKRIGDLGKDAEAIGTSADALSRLRGVARSTGTDVQDLGTFMTGLTGSINDSIGKTTNASQAFAALGTSAEKLQKMSPEDQIKALNKGFANLPDNVEKGRVAMLLAGQDGIKVGRMLTLSTDKFKAAFDAAPLVTDDDVSEARKLEIALNKIGDTVAHLAEVFTIQLAPKIAEMADLLTAFGKKFAGMFGVTIPAPKLPTVPGMPARPPAGGAAGPAALPDQAEHDALVQATLARAQKKVNDLQANFDKQRDKLAQTKVQFQQSRNGLNRRLAEPQQKMRDQHANTGIALSTAKAELDARQKAANSQTQGAALATRMNAALATQVNAMKDANRETIATSGQDEIHRKVGALKGISAGDKKELIKSGYQAREAGKTSALRDELQESTKLPIEKLQEDLARIDKMAKLGEANGGLSAKQAVRAAAQKTAESGLGGPTQFAGALQSNSIEGRSYLLSQMSSNANDPAAVAREGLALTGAGNNTLTQILGALSQRELIASL
jgi:hypothetical protein